MLALCNLKIMILMYEAVKSSESDARLNLKYLNIETTKSIFGIEANMGLEAGIGVWGVAESIFDTFWRQISNGQSLGKNVHAIFKLLAC